MSKKLFRILLPGLAILLMANSDLFAKGKASGEAKKEKSTSSTQEGLKLEVIKLNGSEGKDIIEVAVGSKDHSTLVTAVKATDLVATLTGPGPYTLFAPTNAAFEKLPKGTVENLLKPENKSKLQAILEHHAAAPAFSPDLLENMSELDVVDGPKLKLKVKNGKLFVEDIEVKAAIAAKNGMVYIVDTVILPK